MAVIFLASGLPETSLPSLFPLQEVTFHFFAYLILGYFFIRALTNTNPSLKFPAAFFLTVALVTLYGATDELHQMFVPGRCASGFDLFIDSLGSMAAAAVYPFSKAGIKILEKASLWPR